jgi:hypothetical protein
MADTSHTAIKRPQNPQNFALMLSNKLREKLNRMLQGEPTRPRIAACDVIPLRFVQFRDALIAILEQSFLLALNMPLV